MKENEYNHMHEDGNEMDMNHNEMNQNHDQLNGSGHEMNMSHNQDKLEEKSVHSMKDPSSSGSHDSSGHSNQCD